MIKYAQQYIRSAEAICTLYDGELPLAVFLKQYFQQNKKFGSKDRRYIGQLCYTFFRTGRSVVAGSFDEKIRVALFLCEPDPTEWAAVFTEDWTAEWNSSTDDKWTFIETIFPGSSRHNVFPWPEELSEGMDVAAFSNSHLVQPDLFLRIRPDRKKGVLQKLAENKIPYQELHGDCLALSNATKIDTVLDIDREVVVQDLSSQRIALFFQQMNDESRVPKKIWDCCAASGGKSILANDVMKNTELTVSDVRGSILRNLKERFERAGIKNYQSFIANLASEEFKIQNSKFKIIICDAPCSGSGTWGRTPEQLNFFRQDKISEYANLQKKIASNIVASLADGGYLLYITCSVFEKENEEVVKFIQQEHTQLELVKMELLKGYDKKADTMFGALLKLNG